MLVSVFFIWFFFFFKQKTAYEMRISDWSSDVCSSDLGRSPGPGVATRPSDLSSGSNVYRHCLSALHIHVAGAADRPSHLSRGAAAGRESAWIEPMEVAIADPKQETGASFLNNFWRSEEHTSELQSLMRISYAVFCLKKKKKNQT